MPAPHGWAGNRELVMLLVDRGGVGLHRARVGDEHSRPMVEKTNRVSSRRRTCALRHQPSAGRNRCPQARSRRHWQSPGRQCPRCDRRPRPGTVVQVDRFRSRWSCRCRIPAQRRKRVPPFGLCSPFGPWPPVGPGGHNEKALGLRGPQPGGEQDRASCQLTAAGAGAWRPAGSPRLAADHRLPPNARDQRRSPRRPISSR